MLVSAIDIDFVLPTCTAPKLSAELLGDKFPAGKGLDEEVVAIFVPAHPTLNKVAKAKMVLKE
jgi:hypothetical protein